MPTNLNNKVVESNRSVRLTVAIPTFNRNEFLKTNISILIPQLTPACELLILDNCSTIPVEDTLKEVLVTAVDASIRIVRHRANVGGSENILRCIELAQGEFVWLLGDDDQPIESAIANIFAELDKHPDALVVNMYAANEGHSVRTSNQVLRGSIEYLSAFKSLGDLIFISTMVLRVDRALPYLSEAYQWQSSCAAQLIVVAMILRPDGKAVISSREVFCDIGRAAINEGNQSLVTIGLGISTLLYVPWSPEEARFIKYLTNRGWSARHQLHVLNYLIQLANEGQRTRSIALRYFYLLRVARRISEGFIPVWSIMFLFAWPLIAIPSIGRKCSSAVMRVKNPLKAFFKTLGT